jgi:hypothetical protein
MDKTQLVDRLRAVFLEKKREGLHVDAFGLAPASREFVTNSYVLGVSAPSLIGLDVYDKMRTVIQILFERLTEDERGMINRVRVYDNSEELNYYKESGFEKSGPDDFHNMKLTSPELFELT